MPHKVLEMWECCKAGTLGFVLDATLLRWLEKVPTSDRDMSTSRFIQWMKEMQHKGFFGDFTAPPPALEEFDIFMKVVSGSVERCTSTLQVTGRLQKWRMEKALQQAELLLQNCKCFLGELRYTVLSLHDAVSKQMPLKAIDPTREVELGSGPSAPPSYGDLHEQLKTLTQPAAAHQLPQTNVDVDCVSDAVPPLLVVKNGLLQTAPFPGDVQSQDQAAQYLTDIAGLSKNPFITHTDDLRTDVSVPEWTCTDDAGSGSLVIRSQVGPSSCACMNMSAATFGGPSVHDMASIFETVKIQDRRGHTDCSPNVDKRRESARPSVSQNVHSCNDNRLLSHQMPLVVANNSDGNVSGTYTPFSLQDTAIMKTRLPDLAQGGAIWIKAFLEICAGLIPALGDFRRVFASCSSLSLLRDVEQVSGTVLDPDDLPLVRVVNQLWPTIREKFPIEIKTDDLLCIPPNEGERGRAYLLRAREIFHDRVGVDPASDTHTEVVFRAAVHSSLPTDVVLALRNVVGLSALPFAQWAAHVTLYMDNELDKQAREKKELITLQTNIAKSQWREVKDRNRQENKQLPQLDVAVPNGLNSVSPSLPHVQQQQPFVPQQRPSVQRRQQSYVQPQRSQPVSLYEPVFHNAGRGRFSDRGRRLPRRGDRCFQCGMVGHWARQCQAGGGPSVYLPEVYPPHSEGPARVPLPLPQQPYQEEWHQAPGAAQMPQ